MNNDSLSFSTGSTTLSVGLVLSAFFLGTGGTSASININPDRSGYSQAVINTNVALDNIIKNDNTDSRLDFQKLSMTIMDTYGFSIKQYSEIMQVTRATIYKWHNLNSPLKRVQSRNKNRLKALNKSLFAINENRKKNFATWLRNPLDHNAVLVYSLLTDKQINNNGVIEQIRNINIGLHSLNTSNELDSLLGLS